MSHIFEFYTEEELKSLVKSVGYKILPHNIYLDTYEWKKKYIDPLERKKKDIGSSIDMISEYIELGDSLKRLNDYMWNSPWIEIKLISFDITSIDNKLEYLGEYSVSIMSWGQANNFIYSTSYDPDDFNPIMCNVPVYTISNKFIRSSKDEVRSKIRSDVEKIFDLINIAIRKGYIKAPFY